MAELADESTTLQGHSADKRQIAKVLPKSRNELVRKSAMASCNDDDHHYYGRCVLARKCVGTYGRRIGPLRR
jgi:hypothetical protein